MQHYQFSARFSVHVPFPPLLPFYFFFLLETMSDRSDSQKTLCDNFMSESDPSYHSSIDMGQSSFASNLGEGKTRLLTDYADRDRELRSKFLNDHFTPEQESLISQYMSMRMSGDRHTLRELRHQILVHRTFKDPAPDAVPGLDVQPLREHAWLDSLADDFYGYLAYDVNPPHPPIVDFDSDNDFVAIMDETDVSSSTSGWEKNICWIEISLRESSIMALDF